MFSLEKLIIDVFAPRSGDILTVMYDVPHGAVGDNRGWADRRRMAEEWSEEISRFSGKHDFQVNPAVVYQATGRHNGDLPETGIRDDVSVRLEDVARDCTIILSMPQFSATAPLVAFTRKYEQLRVASLPGVARSMQETGLSADYNRIAETCSLLASRFDRSHAIDVLFSTGDSCLFDTSDRKTPLEDNGRLHPEEGKSDFRLSNLPSGEVCVVPNERPDSKTAGRIPVRLHGEEAVFIVRNNQIVDVLGEGPAVAKKRQEFLDEKALRNIAEVAIGCNEKAAVTGNVLEDEKAGFHWAYGRSDHLGGTVGPDDFSEPSRVHHMDIVYAKGNPIVCQRLDFVFPDGTRESVIRDGLLVLEELS